MVQKVNIQGLYYIAHFDNIPSILENGILSHHSIENNAIKNRPIYNLEVVDRRQGRIVKDGLSLWNFANLYFQPRNAMLYSVIHKASINKIAILFINKNILDRKDIFVTTGNAAAQESQIIPIGQVSSSFWSSLKKETNQEWWNNEDGSKRKIMAECLVPDLITPNYIEAIYVAENSFQKNLSQIIADAGINKFKNSQITVDPKKFFQPDLSHRLTKKISIIRGDMFFSNMQTLTVSVNCVGVMGKGLASTAKYRFPDVYVKYQEVCKNKKLQIGKPYLYKRELSIRDQLGDETLLLEPNLNGNSQTWFLLFPTKNHWRNNSNLEEIEKGLQWLCDNYKSEGIKSLAMPALGCGLGGLQWRDVGPLMCRYFDTLDVESVAIYLPSEKQVEPEFLTSKFLLDNIDF